MGKNVFEESEGVFSSTRLIAIILCSGATLISMSLPVLVYFDKMTTEIIIAFGASILTPLLTAIVTIKSVQKNTEANRAVKEKSIEAQKEVKKLAIEAPVEIERIKEENRNS